MTSVGCGRVDGQNRCAIIRDLPYVGLGFKPRSNAFGKEIQSRFNGPGKMQKTHGTALLP
jgi:hypothetical protein